MRCAETADENVVGSDAAATTSACLNNVTPRGERASGQAARMRSYAPRWSVSTGSDKGSQGGIAALMGWMFAQPRIALPLRDIEVSSGRSIVQPRRDERLETRPAGSGV
jgi:hypothetical protein